MCMKKSYSYSTDHLAQAVATNYNLRQVLSALDLSPRGGNYATVKRLIADAGLDISHFLGHASNRGRRFGPRRPLSDYLNGLAEIPSDTLRRRLIAEGVLQHRCQKCNNDQWLGSPISLELHHIDGNRQNNALANLQVLCPNCHSQTDNYRGRKLKIQQKPRPHKTGVTKSKKCLGCDKDVSRKAQRCKSCATKMQTSRIKWPDVSELAKMVEISSYSAVGRLLGVSNTAVRNKIKMSK